MRESSFQPLTPEKSASIPNRFQRFSALPAPTKLFTLSRKPESRPSRLILDIWPIKFIRNFHRARRKRTTPSRPPLPIVLAPSLPLFIELPKVIHPRALIFEGTFSPGSHFTLFARARSLLLHFDSAFIQSQRTLRRFLARALPNAAAIPTLSLPPHTFREFSFGTHTPTRALM